MNTKKLTSQAPVGLPNVALQHIVSFLDQAEASKFSATSKRSKSITQPLIPELVSCRKQYYLNKTLDPKEQSEYLMILHRTRRCVVQDLLGNDRGGGYDIKKLPTLFQELTAQAKIQREQAESRVAQPVAHKNYNTIIAMFMALLAMVLGSMLLIQNKN